MKRGNPIQINGTRKAQGNIQEGGGMKIGRKPSICGNYGKTTTLGKSKILENKIIFR